MDWYQKAIQKGGGDRIMIVTEEEATKKTCPILVEMCKASDCMMWVELNKPITPKYKPGSSTMSFGSDGERVTYKGYCGVIKNEAQQWAEIWIWNIQRVHMV